MAEVRSGSRSAFVILQTEGFKTSIRVHIEMSNSRQIKISHWRAIGDLGLELAINPFLRAENPQVQENVGLPGADPAAVFGELRTRKNKA